MRIQEARKTLKPSLFQRVKLKDISIFSRQLAVMVNAGVPIVQGVDVISEEFKGKPLGKILKGIVYEVSSGLSLSESLKLRKNYFGELFVSMVEVGEAGGILGFTLEKVSEYLEKIIALRGKVRSAMAYPTIIFIVTVLATVFLLVSIIPTFAKMFQTFGAELPLPTKIVIGVSNFLVKNGVLLFLGLLGVILIFVYSYRKLDGFRYVVDLSLLNLPIFGDILRKSSISRFSRTLGVLLRSGVPILDALEITARTSGNKAVERAVLFARRNVSEGKSVSEPLKKSGIFPSIVVQLITVGEETGELPKMLTKVSDFFDTEVENSVNTLTSILEPIMLVFMGGIVGAMLVAMYLPLFSIAQIIK